MRPDRTGRIGREPAGLADDGGALLRAVRTGACDYFGAVLSPDYNAVHYDHLHLEATDTRFCR